MKIIYLIISFILLNITIQAQTICELYMPIFNEAAKGKYKKAEPILKDIITRQVDEKNENELICFGYAHYELGIMHTDEKYEKFDVQLAYKYLTKSIVILNQAKSINLKATEDANRVIVFATEAITDLLKDYPALVNVLKADETNNGSITQITTEQIPVLTTQSVNKTIPETTKNELKQQEDSQASTDKTVNLIVTGQGKTTEEATSNALRSAIEQAFGAFISSKTEILKDSLIKDEIVSIANGNIQKYEILSSQQLLNGFYTNSLKATVSVTKLTAFSVSKGLTVEFNGGLFAMNILLQELYEKNELIAWQNTKKMINEFLFNGFDYSIETSNPTLLKDTIWKVPLAISAKFNSNTLTGLNILYDFMKASCLSREEAKNYYDIGKTVYPLGMAISQEKSGLFYFRNATVRDEIHAIPWEGFRKAFFGIMINNGIERFDLLNYLTQATTGNTSNRKIILYENFETYKAFLGDAGQYGLYMAGNSNPLNIEQLPDYKDIFLYKESRGMKRFTDFLGKKSVQRDVDFTNQEYENWDETGMLGVNFGFWKKYLENSIDKDILKKFGAKPITSFISILKNGELFHLSLNDIRSFNELKKISKYEVQKK